MISNYLKTAWRNMLRNKSTSVINIGGLSIGMAVAIMIGLWVNDELSFDHYHSNYKRIAQVMQNRTINGDINTTEMIPVPLAGELRSTYGNHFRHVVLASGTWQHVLNVDNRQLAMNGNYMQPDGPEMLTLKMKSGSLHGLSDKSSILLSSSTATAIFGASEAIGNIIRLDNKFPVKVTGVYQDLPANSTLNNLAFIAPWDLYAVQDPNVIKSAGDWGNNSYELFVELNPREDFAAVSSQIKNAKLSNVDAESAKFKPAIFLQPMSRWHLYSTFKNGVSSGGAVTYVWLFATIGLFVLLLACINFMNLSTARSEKRAKEVGVRKAIGSLRRQLILQFFTESTLFACSSFLVAIAIVILTLPLFNQVANKQLEILWVNPMFWIAGIVFSLLVGMLAGSYPAIYLSSFRPVKVLKGSFKAGPMAALPRKVLVVLQFSISIILILGTIVIFRQVKYSQHRETGYNREGLLSAEMNSSALHDHFSSFRNDLLASGAVIDVAESGSPTTGIYNSGGGMKWTGKDPSFNDEFALVNASLQYGKTIGWQIVGGRDFSADYPSDSAAIILNEAAVQYMNLVSPVGQTIDWWGKKYIVIGVAKNMVMQSPYEPAKQTIFYISKGAGNFMNIRLKPLQDLSGAIAQLAAVWKKYVPEEPFDYKFADQEYGKKFQSEERLGTLAGLFTSLAIVISCLGLFGMAVFMAEQRTKEIGVRKVLGASVANLWLLLCGDFIVLIGIALVIATPVSILIMQHWLRSFNYHTGLSVWIFILTAIGAIGITVLTVSYQSIKAALMNPVKSLKTE